MYEINPTPNSDQQFCPNCECLIDNLDTRETINGEQGCINCISKCEWCGHFYFNEDLYDNPFLGYVCNNCINSEDYQKAARSEVIKTALRSLFDSTTSERVENEVIKTAWREKYFDLANELKSDKL